MKQGAGKTSDAMAAEMSEVQREEVSVTEVLVKPRVENAPGMMEAPAKAEDDEDFDFGELTAGSGDFPKETVERVASLSAHGVPDETIRRTLFLSKADLENLKHTESFVFAKGQKLEDLQSNKLAISEGWDNIEALGLRRVSQVLETGLADPRFALMAAKMANTARRPLDPGNRGSLDAGGTIVLHLAKSIREKIREGTVPVQTIDESLPERSLKETRVLPSSSVEVLLAKPGTSAAPEGASAPETSFMAMLNAAFSGVKK